MAPAETSLFELPKVLPLRPADDLSDACDGGRLKLRPDYQTVDVNATLAAFEGGKRAVVCRWATGLGKSVFVAELARRLSARGRVLVIVDVTNLADDLYRTIDYHTGRSPGALTGGLKSGWRRSRIVVATVQTLYASGNGDEWYKQLNPADFAAVIVDECETSIAERYSGVLRYFLAGNPALVVAGCTATPFRGDKRGMAELYDHAADEPGPLNRDILWGRDNGWLVHVRQGFVRVALDFSTLKLKKGEDGVKDYADADLVKMFKDEQQIIELAKGIHAVAAGQPSIVICPNSVEFAKTVSHYLNAERRGCAEAVYGDQGKRCDELMASYKRGDYPYVVSVNKLYKGFDADFVKYVFMCRKTRSRRLYEQAMGRGARPLASVREALNAAADAEARRAIIAASVKPHMVMVDMVGVHPSAKDLGVIDILGKGLTEAARERAKEHMQRSDAPAEQETEQAGREAEQEIAAELRERAERERRRLVQVKAQVEFEESDDLRIRGADGEIRLKKAPPTEAMKRMAVALGFPAESIGRISYDQCRGYIGTQRRKNVKPDWSRVTKSNLPEHRQPAATVGTDRVPEGSWYGRTLRKFGHAGPLPDVAEAKRIIAWHEAQKGAA